MTQKFDMIVVGLTGSIGMGKTNAAETLRREGIAVHDADAAVHELLGPGGAAVAAVDEAFPGVARDGAIDRKELGRRVFHDAEALAGLEAILHPLVREDSRRFLERCKRASATLAVLDIPLLYEIGRDSECDAVILVTAPHSVQRERVLRRPGMTPARLADILARQMPDSEKRNLADFIVDTSGKRSETLRELKRIVKLLESGEWRRRKNTNSDQRLR
jgi:dephospho-CoA kinase